MGSLLCRHGSRKSDEPSGVIFGIFTVLEAIKSIDEFIMFLSDKRTLARNGIEMFIQLS